MAYRSCSTCQTYDHDEQTGEVKSWDYHDPNSPVRVRVPGTLPCLTTIGCPKGTFWKQRSLTSQNWKAYLFHRRCKAVNRWPDDPIVAMNAQIIEEAEQLVVDMHSRQDKETSELLLRRLAFDTS